MFFKDLRFNLFLEKTRLTVKFKDSIPNQLIGLWDIQ